MTTLGEEAPNVLGLSLSPTGKITQDGSVHLDVGSHLGCLGRRIEPAGLQGKTKPKGLKIPEPSLGLMPSDIGAQRGQHHFWPWL